MGEALSLHLKAFYVVEVGLVDIEKLAAGGEDSESGLVEDHDHVVLGLGMSASFLNHVV